MQDRYAGDIGDYLKFAILRAACPGLALGVAWWLYPDEAHNGDGRHIGYLNASHIWRYIDPPLFDSLKAMVQNGERSVSALQSHVLIEGATYHGNPLYFADSKPGARRSERMKWFNSVGAWASDRDVLFLDPDNGLEPAGYSAGSAKAGKSITVDEIMTLTAGKRPLIVYHHQTRRAGGHILELEYWRGRLRDAGCVSVDAIRASAFSARAFFVVNGTPVMRERLEAAVARWQSPRITWHPDR